VDRGGHLGAPGIRRGGELRAAEGGVGGLDLAAGEDHGAAEEARALVPEDAEDLGAGAGALLGHHDGRGEPGYAGRSAWIEDQQSRRSFFHVIKLSSNREDPTRFPARAAGNGGSGPSAGDPGREGPNPPAFEAKPEGMGADEPRAFR